MTSLYMLDRNQDVVDIIPSADILEVWQDMGINEIDTLNATLILTPEMKAILDESAYIGISDMVDKHSFNMYKLINKQITNDEIALRGIQLAFDELSGHGYIRDMRPNNEPVSRTLERILEGSGWRVGYVDENLPAVTGTFYYISRLESISELIKLTGAELKFKVSISDNQITDKYVEAYEQMGDNTGKRFTYGTNSLEIVAEEDEAELYTAIIGRGRGEAVETDSGDASYGRRITFSDVEWKTSEGDPADKPLGQEYVEIPTATEQFGYTDGSPRIKIEDYPNIDDPDELLRASYRDLLSLSRPKVQFKTNVNNVGDLNIGDTVSIIRHDLNLKYQARVFKVKYNRLNLGASELDIGDVVIKNPNKRQASIVRNLASIQRNQDAQRTQINYVIQSADGKNVNNYGNDEPSQKRVGDTWFRDHPSVTGESQILVWNGEIWEIIMDTSDTTKNADAIEEQKKEIEDARQVADEAVNEINTAVQNAGFTSLDDTISYIETVSNNAENNAQQAITDASNAFSEAQTAINELDNKVDLSAYNTTLLELEADIDSAITAGTTAKETAEGLITQVEGIGTIADSALQEAKDAVGTANTAKISADNLSTEVSGLKTDVEGFELTVNDYQDQVSQFSADVNGFQSTVARYETEVDEFGNIVSTNTTQVNELRNDIDGFESLLASYDEDLNGFNTTVSSFRNTLEGLESTVASYETVVDEYGNEVATYATELSTLRNTVNGFESTVAEFDTTVTGYQTSLATLTNTVDGFESTVAEVRSDFENVEIGGRNLVVRTGEIEDSYLNLSGHVTHSLGSSIMDDLIPVKPNETLTFTKESVDDDNFWRYNGYDENQVFVDRTANSRNEFQWTVPSGVHYIRVSYPSNSYPQIERGNKATDWTPAPEDMATTSQVSTLENTVDGLNNLVSSFKEEAEGYSAEVSEFRNTVSGLQSTVASYEVELDEYGNIVDSYATQVATFNNTVNGLESTVAEYEQSVSGYATQLATLSNTVDGFNSTVTRYETQLDEYGNEVSNYATQVSTLENTVDGFNSTVSQVQNDLDNIEIGGRNLFIESSAKPGYVDMDGSIHDRFDISPIAAGSQTTYPILRVKSGETYYFTKIRTDDLDNDIWRIALFSGTGSGLVDRIVNSSDSFPVVIPSGVTTMRASIAKGAYPKIEKGNRPTDWTPAPEDMATSTQVSELSNTVDGFRSSVDKVERDYQGISGTVASHTSSISNINGQIALKANTTTVNALTGRVSTAETGITSNANAIKLKASQSSVDTLSGTVNTLGAQIDVTAGQIDSKVWMSDIDDIEIGGRNLIARSVPSYSSGYIIRIGTIGRPPVYDSLANHTISGYIEVNNKGRTDPFTFSKNTSTVSDDNYFRIVWLSEYGNVLRRDATDDNVYTTKKPANAVEVRLSFPSDSQPKLERGNKATDYTEAPEDTEKAINYVESILSQKHDSIEATVAGIDGRVTTQKQTIDTISGTVSGHGGRLTTVEKTANGIRDVVNNNSTGLSATRTQMAQGFSQIVSSNFIKKKMFEDGKAGDWGGTVVNLNSLEPINGMTKAIRWDDRNAFEGNNIIDVVPGETYYVEFIANSYFANYPVKFGLNTYGPQGVSLGINAMISLPAGRGTQKVSGTITIPAEGVNAPYTKARPLLQIDGPRGGDLGWAYATNLIISPNPTGSQITQLQNNINLRVTKEGLLSQINIEAGRTLIQSDKILLQASNVVFSGTAWIPNSVIGNLSADKITSGRLDAGKITVVNLDANSITSNKTSFVQSAWNAINSRADMDANRLRFTHSDGSSTQIGVNGLERVESGTTRPYQYRTYVGSSEVSGELLANGTNINLPADFKGKDFTVVVSLQGWHGRNLNLTTYKPNMVRVYIDGTNKSLGRFTVKGRFSGNTYKRGYYWLRKNTSNRESDLSWVEYIDTANLTDAIFGKGITIYLTYTATY